MLLDDVELFRPIPLFAPLKDEQLKIIAFSARREVAPEGSVLFRAGDPANCGYVIRSGSVLLIEETAGQEVERAVFGAGTLIGELALIADIDRPVTAMTRADSELIMIPRELFHRVMEEYPETAAAMHTALRGRLRAASSDMRRASMLSMD
ncbi:MAG: cyclic nucleotide-binding domain-containing protein [Pseudomonadota bacterium]